MPDLKLSVIVPTRDRPGKLRSTLAALGQQQDLDHDDYEVILVDDGSNPPAEVPADHRPVVREVRLAGEGRSTARNRGAEVARGELLVFVDDDVTVGRTFLAAHWAAHRERPGALLVGAIRLPEEVSATPFGNFRQQLEDAGMPAAAGPLDPGNCTAQNMAIERSAFKRLRGFDPNLSVAEDQDLAQRFAAVGGEIAFIPAARGTHEDPGGLTIESYCTRAERYMEELVRFGVEHPGLPESIERAQVNGPVRWRGEPIGQSAKKVTKSVLMWPPAHGLGSLVVSIFERIAPKSGVLDRLYRIHLGAHLQRGYRRGLRRVDG